jgi:hypothetical protein
MPKIENASPLAALVDELGELDLEIAPLKSKIKRADALRLLLRNAFKSEPGDKSFSIEGAKWTLLLSACGNVSSVDAAKLASLVGAESFLAMADVSLKALAELPAEVIAAVVSTTQTGTRSLCVVPAPPVPTAVKMAAKRGRR